MYDAMLAETVTITGHENDAIEAYSARTMRPGPAGGVVVIHHILGADRQTAEFTRSLAIGGYNAVMPDLYFREAPGADPDDAMAAARAAGTLPIPDQAAVNCYGGHVVGTPEEGHPLHGISPLAERAGDLTCPLLGLFGLDDTQPAPEHVAELEAALKTHGKTYEFHSYPDAGHAFLQVDRDNYRPEAAVDAWQRIFTWFGAYLAS